MEGGTGSEKADETAIHTNFPAEIQGVAQKGTLVNADEFIIEDSADSYSKKAVTFSNIRRLIDNYAHTYGTGDDATILYDGTDLIIKPDVVGTGDVVVDGHISLADSDTLKLGTGDDASVTYDGTNVVVNPKVAGTGILDVTGTVRSDGRIEEINTTAKTANYTVVATDDNILCDTSGGAFTVTLPATPEDGRVYTIILETAGNTLTIDGNGKNIVGNATLLLNQPHDAPVLIYNGTQWSLK